MVVLASMATVAVTALLVLHYDSGIVSNNALLL